MTTYVTEDSDLIMHQVHNLRTSALHKIQQLDDADEHVQGVRSPRHPNSIWERLVQRHADRQDIPSLERINRHLESPYGKPDRFGVNLDVLEFNTALRGFNKVAPGGNEVLFSLYMDFASILHRYHLLEKSSRYIPLLQKYPERWERIAYHVTHPPSERARSIKGIEALLKIRHSTKILPAFYAPSFVPRDTVITDAMSVAENVVGYDHNPSDACSSVRHLGRTVISMIAEAMDDGLVNGTGAFSDAEWSTPVDSRGSILLRGTRRRIVELILLMRSVRDVIGPDDHTSTIESYDLDRVFNGLLDIHPAISKPSDPASLIDTKEEFDVQSALFRFTIGALIAQGGISSIDTRLIVQRTFNTTGTAYVINDPVWVELVTQHSSKEEIDVLVAFIAEKRSIDPVDAKAYLEAAIPPSLRVGWL
jgi:hypothetical protein